MKTKPLIALAMLSGGAALAATTVNFGPASSCPTYCTGFTTDKARYTLDWLNATYANTAQPHTLLSVNSVTYSGNTTATLLSTIGSNFYYQVDGRLQAANGATLTTSYMLHYWTTRATSGRDAGHLVPHRMVSGGDLIFP